MEEKQFDNNFANWQRQSAFAPNWSYSYVNNSQYYASIPAPYNVFMRRYVQHSLFWADGWNPFFHNAEQGVFSTGLGGAICKRLADKVYGGKIYFKNVSMVDDDDVDLDHIDEVKPNESILTLLDWAEEVDFYGAVAKSIDYALRGGTSILKLNKNRHGKIWVEALRIDQAYPNVNGDGSVERLTSMILANIPYDKENTKESTTTYVLQEERYFGDYTRCDGEIECDVPLVEYKVHKLSGDITLGVAKSNEKVRWEDLPKEIKKAIKNNCPTLMIDKPIRLPFNDLGVYLVKATDSIPSLPMLPFGEPLLHSVIPHLQAFDYAFSAQCTDMYLARGRVIMPKGIANASDGAYSGLDSLIYEKAEYVNPDDQKPLPIQFEVRSEEWKAKFDSILNLIALNIGVSNITLASFLQDNSAAKTAREVSQQENETMQFVQTTRAVMEKPINKLINAVRLYMGLKDKIAIRWSNASLENPYINAETLSMAVQGGFISKWKAIQRFNVDDNDVQLAKEYKRIMKDQENSSFGDQQYSDDENMDYFSQMGGQTIPRDEWEKQFGEQKDGLVYDNTTTESTSDNN